MTPDTCPACGRTIARRIDHDHRKVLLDLHAKAYLLIEDKIELLRLDRVMVDHGAVCKGKVEHIP
jgi:hypothetical protein